MKTRILASVLIVSGLFVAADKSYGCGNQAPVAILTAIPQYAAPGRTVILDGSGSYDFTGSIVKYEWDWTADSSYDYNETSGSHPDGKFDGITTHVYSSAGTYTARLRVTDNGSPALTDTDTFTVYVGRVFNVTDSLSYDSIQGAIDEAGTNDVIKVYPGRYIENIDFNDVKITLTSIDADDPEVVAATIIDGDANGSVVTFGSGDANSIITGFTITNGDANNGGGIDCNGVSPEISNCVIADNNSSDYGGGMYCTGAASQPTITNCMFVGNTAGDSSSDYGGGMYNNDSSPTVVSCVFRRNFASGRGGGMCNNGSESSPVVRNCIFSHNYTYSDSGGGMCNLQASPTVTNCVFDRNYCQDSGAGMYNTSSSTRVINCTFSGNYVGGPGDGIYNSSCEPNITNCIIWGKHDRIDPNFNGNVSYCDIKGGYDGGAGNINSDPLFVEPLAGAFRQAGNPAGPDGSFATRDDSLFLRTNSPCIDEGTNSVVNESTDIIGNNRIANGDHSKNNDAIVDMGAYELPTIWYVDKESAGGNGKSWVDAYDDLQDALTNANVKDGNEIWVLLAVEVPSENPYKPGSARSDSFELIEGVALYGGFIDSEKTSLRERDWLNSDHETILSGDINSVSDDDSYHVVKGADGAILDGFTITGGNADGSDANENGGGIYCDGTSPIISNCKITGNSASSFGGGMYCANSASPTVSNCTITGNNSNNMGGGMYNRYCDRLTLTNCKITDNNAGRHAGGIHNYFCGCVTLTNCTIAGNDADEHGGGIKNKGCDRLIVTNCTIADNNAGEFGGGMGNYDCNSVTVTNSVFTGNIADEDGGGIYNDEFCPTLTNCTFSGNNSNGQGGGMYNYKSLPIVTNCIFWDNDSVGSGDEIHNSSSNPVFGYCDIAGSGGSSSWDANLGIDLGGNIDADPCFADAGNPAGPDGLFMTSDDGLRLIDNGFIIASPCVDAADGYAVPLKDILGLERVDISDVNNTGTGEPNYADIGAYENYRELYPLYDMEVSSVTEDGGTITIVTTGATYVLDSDSMDMYRRIDPSTNELDTANGGKGRKVAELTFEQDIGSLSIEVNNEQRAVVESSKARFDFYSESFFLITAKDSLVYDHNSLIDASWNAPLDASDRYLDRMWTDGYGGSLHANVSGNAAAEANEVDYTKIAMSAGDVMGHMVYPPKFFDFEGLYGKDEGDNDVRPFVYFMDDTEMNGMMEPNGMDEYIENGFGVFVLWSDIYDHGATPLPLDREPGVLGYTVRIPWKVEEFVEAAHDNGFKVIAYSTNPENYWSAYSYDYPKGHPRYGRHQDIGVTLEMMRNLQAEYDFDGWYFDNGDAGDVMDNYNFMRQVRSDVGDDGIIYHHDSIDVWDVASYDGKFRGLRAIFVDAYVNYAKTGESGWIADVDTPNEPYFRYFSAGYGMSQAYSSHKVQSDHGNATVIAASAMSREEVHRLMGQNLNGCARARSYNYDSWESHFKPVYDVRKQIYQDDPNNFVPDVNWPIDTDPNTGGWFRDPANINVTDVNDANTTFIITWTTPEPADSNVVYAHAIFLDDDAYWWHWKYGGRHGGVHDANMVTNHSITLTGLDPNFSDSYEVRIRSTNDANDPPAVPGQIIWGYVGKLEDLD